MTRKVDTDKITAVLVLIFSGVFLWQLKYIHSPLDVIFPRTILIALIVLSIILLGKAVFRPSPGSQKALFQVANGGKLAAGLIGIVIWLFLIPLIGFAVTSGAALAVLSAFLGKKADRTPRRILSTLFISAAIVCAVYYFFAEFMEVQLPRGILF
jgi:putative tricarboxylic transport membrane protein